MALKFPENAPLYFQQYRHVPHIIAEGWPPKRENHDAVLVALLNRDAMEGDPEWAVPLWLQDAKLSFALEDAAPEWLKALSYWAQGCGFSQRDWWKSLTPRITP
jgi:hypothetical protein